MKELGPENRNTHLLLDLRDKDPDDAANKLAYEKGYFLVRLIEETVGRERWDAYLRDYFERNAFRSMTTDDSSRISGELLAKVPVPKRRSRSRSGSAVPHPRQCASASPIHFRSREQAGSRRALPRRAKTKNGRRTSGSLPAPLPKTPHADAEEDPIGVRFSSPATRDPHEWLCRRRARLRAGSVGDVLQRQGRRKSSSR